MRLFKKRRERIEREEREERKRRILAKKLKELKKKEREEERQRREKQCPNCYKEKAEKDYCNFCGWRPCIYRTKIECPASLNKKLYSWCESKSCGRYEIENVDPKRSRRIPQHVKNEVWRRDKGRCAECGSRINLEYDHIILFSKGGANTARIIELLCEKCNRTKHSKI